ncbi:MAG: tRNA glutamyl-Q(34) synthetase GluQRS [Paucimonas sp.]|nr:tRNA glutamyl-Q(34) synthetase GluQRS [Paucimonas sp.]
MGSLVAAMASYLDAKAHKGEWLVRIEDVDGARTVAGAAEDILRALSILGMCWNSEIVWQSKRYSLYEAALGQLGDHIYACGCTRREIADSRLGIGTDGSAIYPGTCRKGLAVGKAARAHRLRVPDTNQKDECIRFQDRWRGEVVQHLAVECGDFVLRRADGFWAYQLAVVVDDADQGVTHVVRGMDLIGSTARQIYLQRLLAFHTPEYMHVPVVTNAAGEKLSKQTGAAPLDLSNPVETLANAARFLGLDVAETTSTEAFWNEATQQWATRFEIR